MDESAIQIKAVGLAKHFIEDRSRLEDGSESESESAGSSESLVAQMRHRLRLVEYWGIGPGDRVLEIGCGQGDCTVVLADAVEEGGRVDAIDPGSLTYGSPFNLGQAQGYIKKSEVGRVVEFHCPVDPVEFLEGYVGEGWDYVVLCHSTYYFATPSVLPHLIYSLIPHTRKICIAEWSLLPSPTSRLNSTPHILAVLLAAHLESLRVVPSSGNIRCVLTPSRIKEIVLASGTSTHDGEGGKMEGKREARLVKETLIDADEGLRDAYWEICDLLREGRMEAEVRELFGDEGGKGGKREGERMVVEAMFEGLRGVVEGCGGVEGVRGMRVWVGVFDVGCS